MARRRLRLVFGPGLVTEPVIWRLGREFEITTNVRRAEVSRDSGWVLLELTGEPEVLDDGISFLTSLGVAVEPAEGDMVDK
ncbi:MAG: NIL domain-containing protein [Candidatus Dormibacteraceae bacterium]